MLVADCWRPIGSGFFFSRAHSTIVAAVGVGITIAGWAVFVAVVNASSTYETLGGTIGTLTTAGFLYLIARLNLMMLGRHRQGVPHRPSSTYDEAPT
jgi:high-affinity nickel-transport protein